MEHNWGSNPKQFVTNMKNFLNALPTLQSYRITEASEFGEVLDMPISHDRVQFYALEQ